MKHLVILILLAAGCTTRKITIGTATYTSTRFGNKETIGQIEYRHGDDVFIIKSYQSDQVEALGVVAESAARGAAQGLK